MASRNPARPFAALSDMLRDSTQGEAVWSGIVDGVQAAVYPRERDLQAAPSEAGKYGAFFRGALEFAILPYARCPQYAASLGMRNRMLAWQWAAKEIRDNVDACGLLGVHCGFLLPRLCPEGKLPRPPLRHGRHGPITVRFLKID